MCYTCHAKSAPHQRLCSIDTFYKGVKSWIVHDLIELSIRKKIELFKGLYMYFAYLKLLIKLLLLWLVTLFIYIVSNCVNYVSNTLKIIGSEYTIKIKDFDSKI